MNLFNFIRQLCFSVLFVLAPTLGFSSEINHTSTFEVSCCDASCDLNISDSSFCEHINASPDDCKDKCKDSCKDHASHVVPQTIQSPTSSAKQPNSFVTSDKLKVIFYQGLSLQNFIFQFWNPPKYV